MVVTAVFIQPAIIVMRLIIHVCKAGISIETKAKRAR